MKPQETHEVIIIIIIITVIKTLLGEEWMKIGLWEKDWIYILEGRLDIF
jgi:hypothetical protein